MDDRSGSAVYLARNAGITINVAWRNLWIHDAPPLWNA